MVIYVITEKQSIINTKETLPKHLKQSMQLDLISANYCILYFSVNLCNLFRLTNKAEVKTQSGTIYWEFILNCPIVPREPQP